MKGFNIFLRSPVTKTIFVLYLIVSIAAVCSVSTAKLTDVQLCGKINGDSECDSDHSVFAADVPVIYCSAKLKYAPEKTKVTFTWKYEGEVIGKADVEYGSGIVYSYYRSPGFMRTGNYSVTAKINTDNADPVTKEFKIE